MRFASFKRALYFSILSIAFLTPSCSGHKAATNGKEASPSATREQKAREALDSALDQGKATGSASVKIDLQEDPSTVQSGDLVLVHYTVSFEDGSLIRTTDAAIADDDTIKKSGLYTPPARFGPAEIRAGEQTDVPGIDRAVIGMTKGESQSITIPPDEAHQQDPKKILRLPRVIEGPRLFKMSFKEYSRKFSSFPKVGREIDYSPYLSTRIAQVTDEHITLELMGEAGTQTQKPYGTVKVEEKEGNLIITVDPVIGGSYETKGPDGQWYKGRVVESQIDYYTVDFNPPFAGEPLVLDLKVIDVKKASRFASIHLPWLSDHEAALEKASKENKPLLLVLYSSTCGWSTRLLEETLTDPRIKMLKDEFVWAKIDSRVQEDLYAFYEQEGYPMTLVLSPTGVIMHRIEGYRPAGQFRDEIKDLGATKAG